MHKLKCMCACVAPHCTIKGPSSEGKPLPHVEQTHVTFDFPGYSNI